MNVYIFETLGTATAMVLIEGMGYSCKLKTVYLTTIFAMFLFNCHMVILLHCTCDEEVQLDQIS